MMRIGQNIKALRKQRRLTQQALAVKAGLSLGYLARLEIGMHEPTLTMLGKLAKALKVPVADLLK